MTKQKGFTILEMTIVVLISSIALFIVSTLFIAQLQLYRSESLFSEVREQNLLTQNIITRTIEESFNVVVNATINSEDYDSDADTIILQLPSIDADQNTIAGSYDYMAFERDGTDPTKIISNTEIDLASTRPAGKKTITQFVNSLNFGYNDAIGGNIDLVEITIITQKEVGEFSRESKTFKAVKLKNK
ncbi:MAG: prepilin-type N-terminal cleavage/methylation domain-containing protein [Parcubacteria group bacterium]|nr:prepilin-type N-terminal cleavage/methylation domain-containing protein [Parcubacteria group bacterium]